MRGGKLSSIQTGAVDTDAGPVLDGPEGDLFHADVIEVVHTHLDGGATMLVIEWWTPTHGLRRVERK